MTRIGYTLDELLPHAGPMILLDEVLSVSGGGIRARASARRDGLFVPASEQDVPAWMGMEYLAQAIAAWSGFHELEQGRTVQPGLLVGARAFRSSVGRIPCGLPLSVEAERLYEDRQGISVFEGRVAAGAVEQTTRVKVFLPEDLETYLKDADDD